MNKEQQELSETRMGTELPPLSVTESDRLRAERLTELEWLAAYAECSPIEMVATRYCRERQLLAVLERERELQAKIAVGDGSCDHCGAVPSIIMPTSLCDECVDGVKRAEAAEFQLLAKDALIASLNAEILKQNKAEEELLATGEKLAEERK